jgi:hypothetical protein
VNQLEGRRGRHPELRAVDDVCKGEQQRVHARSPFRLQKDMKPNFSVGVERREYDFALDMDLIIFSQLTQGGQ